jgi:hypothetical protein
MQSGRSLAKEAMVTETQFSFTSSAMGNMEPMGLHQPYNRNICETKYRVLVANKVLSLDTAALVLNCVTM